MNYLQSPYGTIAEHRLNDALGYRSPPYNTQIVTPPGQGRSIREYDEQMTALRKENFNLKLRIYFLEEKNPAPNQLSDTSPTSDPNLLFKQNVDLKVELESLRKELQEKQDLLCQAAKAMELMEETQKETEKKSQSTVEELEQKIRFLEMEIEAMEKGPDVQSTFSELLGVSVTNDLEVQEKIDNLQANIDQLTNEVSHWKLEFKELKQENGRKDDFINELQRKLEDAIVESNKVKEQFNKVSKSIDDIEKNKRATGNIDSGLKELKSENKLLVSIVNNLQKEIERNKLSLNEKLMIMSNQSRLMKQLNLTNLTSDLADQRKVLKEKEIELEDVKEQLRKKSAAADTGVKSIQLLLKNIKELEMEVNQLKSNGSTLNGGSNIIKAKETLPITSNSVADSTLYDAGLIDALKNDLKVAHLEIEQVNQWRKECADICSMLTSRLIELAGFLDSLLKNKDVLDILAQDRRKEMRKAVDKSLDLSRSLHNMSLSISGHISLTEQNLLQFSSLTDMLNDSFDNKENTANFTDSLIQIKSDNKSSNQQLVEALRTEVRQLKNELDKRAKIDQNLLGMKKDRKSLVNRIIEPNSGSESWSEPDRIVSHARIGLDESFRMEQLKKSTTTTSSNDGDLNRSGKKSKLPDKIVELEVLLAERDNTILKQQCSMVESDNRLKEERLKVLEISKELDKIKTERNELAKSTKDCDDLLKKITEFETEMNVKSAAIDKLKTERDNVLVDYRVATMKLSELQANYNQLKEANDDEINRLQKQHEENISKVNEHLRKNHAKEVEAVVFKYEHDLCTNWVTRENYELQKKQMEQLQKVYDESVSEIEDRKETEQSLNRQIIEHERSLRTMKKALDDASLQASKAIIERTKAMTDKLQLEQLSQNLQSKLDSCIMESTEINLRIAQLENTNAQLQNKMVTQSMRGTQPRRSNRYVATESLPSGSEQSEYTSDELNKRMENSSPDLGIESDAGCGRKQRNRPDIDVTAVEATSTCEITKKAVDESASDGNVQPKHDCARIDREYAELNHRLYKTHCALEDTYKRLRVSNERKVKIEQDIRQEIYKTHNVLRNVRTNMEKVEIKEETVKVEIKEEKRGK